MNLATGQQLGGRYAILSQLGQGGFGATFLAEDRHLPADSSCVVKQLKPQGNDPFTLQTARRLFKTEAQTLHLLGTHSQIPQLYAYFEEGQEFYLVQEYIEGHNLSEELASHAGQPPQRKDEDSTIALLQEILEILVFVHSHNVIHRDVNPNNIIRRQEDGKLVLIDFGTVKQITTQVISGENNYTVAIGTPGYLPSEQANGYPKLSSDVYGVGMIGIYALTGCLPHQLPKDETTGEVTWQDLVSVRPEFAKVLDKMVCYDFRERYEDAQEALEALQALKLPTNLTVAVPSPSISPKRKISWLKKGLIALSIAGLGTVVVLGATYFINSANATELYNRGNTLYELNRYEDALNAYSKALDLRSDYPQAWKGQGDALLSLQRSEEALDAYDRAIQIQPNYSLAWIGRGKALDRLQRHTEAIDALNQAISLQPNSLEAWETKGNVQIKLEQYSDAISSFERLLELDPNIAFAWYRRGWALQNLRQYEEAVTSYQQALELQPDFDRAWYQQGNAFINLQDFESAIASYDQAVQFNPKFALAWYSKGTTLNSLRRYEEAIPAFDNAIKYKSNYYEAWYHRGWSFHQLQRYAEAVNSYEKALQIRNNDAQGWYNQGNALYNLREYSRALASYNKALAIAPSRHEIWNSKGNVLSSLERYPEAIQAYDEALRYKSNYREAKEGKARAQQEIERLKVKEEKEEID